MKLVAYCIGCRVNAIFGVTIWAKNNAWIEKIRFAHQPCIIFIYTEVANGAFIIWVNKSHISSKSVPSLAFFAGRWIVDYTVLLFCDTAAPFCTAA